MGEDKRYSSVMATPEILMTAPMADAVIDALAAKAVLHKLWEADDADAPVANIATRIRGLATSTLYGRVGADLFDKLPALEIVASFGVGYENVDAAAAAERGIVVTNTPGVLDDEVADLTIGLLIATLRQIPQADRYLRAGHWPQGNFPLSPTLRGRTVGILGLGNIGKAIARRLEGFGVAIHYHSRHQQPGVDYPYHASPRALAEACDLLIAILPGGAATRHIVDAHVLAALGPDGVFLNVARGSVVDQDALIAALADGTILAAGLDVFADEPNVPEALMRMGNVVLLPHIGSASVATRAAMGKLVADNLLSWFDTGRPITPVPESLSLLR